MFRLVQDALPHLHLGASIINTSSVDYDQPKPTLLPYATTKGAIANFTAGLAQLLGDRGIRVNAVAPGPIWTPLIPSTMPQEQVAEFGKNTPLGRPGQLPNGIGERGAMGAFHVGRQLALRQISRSKTGNTRSPCCDCGFLASGSIIRRIRASAKLSPPTTAGRHSSVSSLSVRSSGG